MERTRATSNAPASSTRIATNGSAIRVISEPKIEIVAADHTRTNALFCQSGEAKGCARGAQPTRPIASQTGLRYTSPASVRQNSRTPGLAGAPIRLIH